jgi:signal transduction histidine kinase
MLLPYPSVLLAAWLGGTIAGLVAVVATTLGLAYFTLHKTGPFFIAAQHDALDLCLFSVIATVMVLLMHRRAAALQAATAAQTSAEEASDAKETIMAVVAHDLRNPLHTVNLTIELLAAKLDGDIRVMDLLERMRRSTQRAIRLVDAALEQARYGDGLLRVKKSPHALTKIVDDVVGQLGPMAAAHDITLERPAHEALEGTVPCDADRLMQILGNLLGNALKFTPPGGTVRLGVRRITGGVELAVSDSGRGMSADELTHCFERLWHGPGPGHGTGLGLWIAKALVEAHGGHIKAESELGRGTTMRIFLPDEITQRGAETVMLPPVAAPT